MDSVSVRKGYEDGKGVQSMKCKVVFRDGQSAVVEWVDNGKLFRGILPASSIRANNEVYKTELRRAAPYGVAWEEVVTLQATSELLAANLRKRGIWTMHDLVEDPDLTQGAIMETYGVDYQTLVRLAVEEVKK